MNPKPVNPHSIEWSVILDYLSTRQFLHPHRSLEAVLEDAGEALGLCPQAADEAMRWLELRPDQIIGRLKRAQLSQLAQSILRIWRAHASQPSIQAS